MRDYATKRVTYTHNLGKVCAGEAALTELSREDIGNLGLKGSLNSVNAIRL